MYCTIMSGALLGVNAYPVQVEVDVDRGLPSFHMVGSLGTEVRESKERVWAALKNAGMVLPPMYITVNLSPADRRKEGTAFDLPIAVGLLEALDFFPKGRTDNILFLGELGLNGEIRPVRGVLPIVREAAKEGVKECILPKENAKEGGVIPGIIVRGAESIQEVVTFLRAEEEERDAILPNASVEMKQFFANGQDWQGMDFCEVSGQETAKRAAEIAAAGFHNLLMSGPPGAGKSMIAKRIPGIMPALTVEESLEVSAIYSVAGQLPKEGLVLRRPFQSPHHTISNVALIGGGALPRPGMISLAHRGVLFLDELTEFRRDALDSMRQPLEDRMVQVVRVGGSFVYPTDFMLVCAMNPCPCGFYPDRNKCRCTLPQIKRYLGKVSGPILDRIDLCVELQAVDIHSIQNKSFGESSEKIRSRVQAARNRQKERFAGSGIRFNADIAASDMDDYCALGTEEKKCMEELYQSMGLSARSYHRIVKVARTIADLADSEQIHVEHLLEAACYRPAQDYWM